MDNTGNTGVTDPDTGDNGPIKAIQASKWPMRAPIRTRCIQIWDIWDEIVTKYGPIWVNVLEHHDADFPILSLCSSCLFSAPG